MGDSQGPMTSNSGFPCPYLKGSVELTPEREMHIAEHHPDLLPEHRQAMIDTLAKPDEVRKSSRFGNARLFSRWFTDVKRGKHVVVVIVTEERIKKRHWIVTAYVARKLTEGDIEWKKKS